MADYSTGIETTTWFDCRPTHRTVPPAITKQREIVAEAWQGVDAVVENRQSYPDDADYWDALREAEANALLEQNRLHEMQREYNNLGIVHTHSPLTDESVHQG